MKAQLSFCGSGDLEVSEFGDIATIKAKKFNPSTNKEVYECVELEHLSQVTGDILHTVPTTKIASQKNHFDVGSVLFCKLRPYLRKYALPKFSGVCSSEIWVMHPSKKVTSEYLFQLVQTDRFISIASKSTGSKMPRADWSLVSESIHGIPNIKSQIKISRFLSSVDEKIKSLNDKYRLMKEYRDGISHEIINQSVRFKDDNGQYFPAWKTRSFSDFVTSRNELPTKDFIGNLCSLTIENGIEIKPSRYIREHLVKDTEKAYKVVCSGDFALNPMNLRFGAIGLNHYDEPVLISKYYDVFYCDETVDKSFFEVYLSSKKMLNCYNKVATGTLEEKKRVHFSEFLRFNKALPCLKEQQKISQFLQAIDKKIDGVGEQIMQTKQFKKGLLQQMFV